MRQRPASPVLGPGKPDEEVQRKYGPGDPRDGCAHRADAGGKARVDDGCGVCGKEDNRGREKPLQSTSTRTGSSHQHAAQPWQESLAGARRPSWSGDATTGTPAAASRDPGEVKSVETRGDLQQHLSSAPPQAEVNAVRRVGRHCSPANALGRGRLRRTNDPSFPGKALKVSYSNGPAVTLSRARRGRVNGTDPVCFCCSTPRFR